MDQPIAELTRPLGAQQAVADDWGEPPSFVSEQEEWERAEQERLAADRKAPTDWPRKPGESEIPVLVFPGKTEVVQEKRSGIHHMNVGFHVSFNVKDLFHAISKLVDADSDAQ